MWSNTDELNREHKELIEYERGSVLGGLMTVGVFLGFGYLLLNDISYNLNKKPFTFEVKEKYMSAKETAETSLNLASNNQSLNMVFGIKSNYLEQRNQIFDPFDNDYIEIKVYQWNKKFNDEVAPNYLIL